MSYRSFIKRLEKKHTPLSDANITQLKKARRTLSHKPALASRLDRLLSRAPSKDDDAGYEFGAYGDG